MLGMMRISGKRLYPEAACSERGGAPKQSSMSYPKGFPTVAGWRKRRSQRDKPAENEDAHC